MCARGRLLPLLGAERENDRPGPVPRPTGSPFPGTPPAEPHSGPAGGRNRPPTLAGSSAQLRRIWLWHGEDTCIEPRLEKERHRPRAGIVDVIEHPTEVAGIRDGRRRICLDQRELCGKLPGPEIRPVKALPRSRSPAEDFDIFGERVVRACPLGQAYAGMNEII